MSPAVRSERSAPTRDFRCVGGLLCPRPDLGGLREIETALEATIFEDVAVGAILTVGDLTAICAETLAECRRSQRAR